MENYFWTGLYAGWGWFIWFGMMIFGVFIVANMAFGSRSEREIRDGHHLKRAMGILDVRYASGEIDKGEFHRVKAEIIESARLLYQETSDKAAAPQLHSRHAHS